ncbi:MAG: D-arabinono-1,4-lactone oxidase [Pirellulales bacterium]
MSSDSSVPQFINFGKNVAFQAAVLEQPRSEAEVLEVLDRHAGRKIRVVGRLHSWSECPRGEDVVIDLQYLNQVKTQKIDGRIWAEIGAGCQIKRVLSELAYQADSTLPSLGLITEQSIAGAMATGTHGSGKHSLSHYADEIRIATYDAESGKPVIRTVRDGAELEAARCSLGCLGVIVSVGLWARPCYRVEEFFERYASLDETLEQEIRHPLQQFYYIPWSWDFYAQHRFETESARSALAALYRLYFFLTFDLGLHLALIPMVRWFRLKSFTKFFFRKLLPWTVVKRWRVRDWSSDQLIMEHELFTHIEIEIFVKRSRMKQTLELVRDLIRLFDGSSAEFSDEITRLIDDKDVSDRLRECSGRYTHHYPICIRRILPDATLVSPASGGEEDWFAVSFISLERPQDRSGFLLFAERMAELSAKLFDARPHWGKVCPLSGEVIERLYPRLAEFRQISGQFDPRGRFRNAWADRMLFNAESSAS